MQLHLSANPRAAPPGGLPQLLAPLDAGLLAWLALEGPTPRNRLAALLWPEKPPEAARNSLRQRLFQLRRQLGVDLVEGGATAALADGVTHDLLDADTLLEGVPLEVGGEFAQWLALQRDRRRGRVRGSLTELADMAESAKDWDDALTHARELLALEPLSEDAHRRVMRLHYLRGDRAAALLAFDRCEQVLKDEVGAQPSAETMALLATVSDSARSAALPAHAAVPASVLRPPRLVGRARELAALEAAWQAGHVAGLIGEAGLGKTRLLHEFAAARADVVIGTGRPGDAGVPFATLARLLRAVANASPTALPAATRGEIARVLPEFDAGGVAPRGEGQRLVLLRAVQALLAARPPLSTIVVDDLHFADAASLDLLGSLVDGEDGQADALPLRWVLAWRPAEAGSPLHELLDRLTESARLLPIALAPLDEAALAELVDSLGLPGVDGRALAAGLLQRTGGNPLFVLETLKQAWVERTLAQLADARQLPRPLSVGRLIERRLAQLSPGALALARVASIAGVDFTLELAESVLQAGAMQFADAINELEAAQVLRGTAFAHDLVFDAVRAGVPRTVAQLTHARVAAWLEAHAGEPARMARHWIDAGRAAQALPWLARAAEAARLALRPREQLGFLDEKSRFEEAAGDLRAALNTGLEAADVDVDIDNDAAEFDARCERLDRMVTGDADRVQVLLARCNAHKVRGEFAVVVDHARRALQLALPLGDAELTAGVQTALGGSLACLDRYDEALPHQQAALAWLDVHGNLVDRAIAHGELAMALDNLGRLDEALAHHRLACDLCRQGGHAQMAPTAAGNLACNRMDAGDLRAADDALQQAQQWLAAADGLNAQAGTIQLLRALTLAHRGRYTQALVNAELGVAAMRRHQLVLEPRARLREGQVWAQLGQWARVGQALDATAHALAEGGLGARAQHAGLQWLAVQAEGVGAAARTAARQAMRAVDAELQPGDRPDLALPLRIVLAEAGGPDELPTALAQIDAARVQAQRIGHLGTVQAAHLRAAALATPFEPERARREALAALALAERGIGNTVLLPAELWLHAGRALLAADDRRGHEVLGQGREWVLRAAQDEVPEPFRDSFLHRNPVNRELLALAARQQLR